MADINYDKLAAAILRQQKQQQQQQQQAKSEISTRNAGKSPKTWTPVITHPISHQLKSENEEANQDSEEEEVHIQFQQWTNVDRSELVSHIRPVSEFISLLIEKLQALTTHSFIATSQAKYLKKVKEELREDKVIVLGDFAENYKFIIQDEIQGFHWNKQSCTLHPIVIYHIKDNKLTERCLCFISDDLNHDTGFVHEVMK